VTNDDAEECDAEVEEDSEVENILDAIYMMYHI